MSQSSFNNGHSLLTFLTWPDWLLFCCIAHTRTHAQRCARTAGLAQDAAGTQTERPQARPELQTDDWKSVFFQVVAVVMQQQVAVTFASPPQQLKHRKPAHWSVIDDSCVWNKATKILLKWKKVELPPQFVEATLDNIWHLTRIAHNETFWRNL